MADTPRRSPCQWIARDNEGRPRCEHGWAKKTGPWWRCPMKRGEAVTRYNHSEGGAAKKRAWNHSPQGRESKRRFEQTAARASSKALWSLTRPD